MGFDLEDYFINRYVDHNNSTEKKSFNGNMSRSARGYISDSLNGVEVVRGSASAEAPFNQLSAIDYLQVRLARIPSSVFPANSMIDFVADFCAFENYKIDATGINYPFGFRNTMRASFVKNSANAISAIGVSGGTESNYMTNFTYAIDAVSNPFNGKAAGGRIIIDGGYIYLDAISPRYVSISPAIQAGGVSNLKWQVNYEYTVLTGSNRVI